MDEYEIVKTEPAPESITDIMPVFEVKARGAVLANFAEKTEILKAYMAQHYPDDLEVTEENLKAMKADLASLRKVEKEFKALIKAAKDEFDEPIKITLTQASAFETVIMGTVGNLAAKIDKVESGLKDKRKEERIKLAELVIGTKSDEVQCFAAGCMHWICKESWENKTYTDAQVRNDVETAVSNIELALQMFQGKFRAQALDKFGKTGSMVLAQALVKELEEADRRQEEREKAKPEVVQEVKPEISQEMMMSELNAMADVPRALNADDLFSVSTPESYLTDEKSEEICNGFFVVKGRRGCINWLLDMAVFADVKMQKADNALILKKAELIKAKENQ